MNGKQLQQLADMVCFTGMHDHDHDHLCLRRKALQRSDRDIQIGDICPRVIIASTVNEFPHKKIGRQFLQRPVQIAGRVETFRRNAKLLVQGTEIGMEGGFDQGEKCFHGTAVYIALIDC